MESILGRPDNCWRIAQADRAAFLVDGESYFAALRSAILRAQHSVILVGWDMHSRIDLLRGDVDDGAPTALGPLLNYCAQKRPELNIFVLSWDFAMIYALERELFPRYRLRWRSHERVRFCLDDKHPFGASQHQKLAIIDDGLAFSGGFDLAQWRWDTRQHRVDDKRRRDPLGRRFPPFHDVQIAVSGEAARALAELARARWQEADGREIPDVPTARGHDCWPADVNPAIGDVDIGIALTRPQWKDQEELRQVEQLFLDSIAAATEHLYLENQYFTSHRIGDALEASLARGTGPEIVIVLPHESRGWLEQHTMDVLRGRLLKRLRKADHAGRLRVYCPRLADGTHLLVHAKVTVADDCFVRIGSANLNNRSMGLDRECDIALEAKGRTACRDAIRNFRRELLAEHLGVDKARVEAAEAEHRSLIAAIESLRGGDRTLQDVDHEVPEYLDRSVPDAAVIDPEKPVEARELLRYLRRGDTAGLGPAAKLLILAGALLAIAALWRWSPAADFLSLQRAQELATAISQGPAAGLFVALAFTLGSLVVVPLTLMIVATISVFGPWTGSLYALGGAELAAVVTFLIGRAVGRDALSRIAGGSDKTILRKLADPGVLSIAVLRLVPVAPFSVVNLVAGASRISFVSFAVGSFAGLMPGTIAVAVLTDRIIATLRAPDALNLATLLGAAAAVLAVFAVLRRWRRKRP